VWHDSLICVTWLVHMCGTNHVTTSRCVTRCRTHVTHQRVMSHISTRHVTPIIRRVWHDSLICVVWITSQRWDAWHDTFICVSHRCVTWHVYMWAMRDTTHLYARGWRIYICGMNHLKTLLCVTRHLYMRGGGGSGRITILRESFTCVTWRIHMRGMTHLYVWHDSFALWHDLFICVAWLMHIVARLIHMCGMTHSYVWHDSFICVAWLIHIVAWLIHTCGMTHSYCGMCDLLLWPLHVCDITRSYV